MSNSAFIESIVHEASQSEELLAEALMLSRMCEWETDLYLFSLECLGNNPETDERLAGNLEPRVAAYTRWVGNKILEWLEARRAGKVNNRRKMMVLVPRECFKTTNITTTVPVWLQLHDPNISIVVDAAKMKNMADKMLDVIKEHMRGTRPTAKLIETFGDFYHPKRKWGDASIVGARRKDMARKDKTVEITSVDVGATGSHPDVWIWDDPVTRELATEAHFTACWNHHLGMFPIIRKDGLYIVVATRYHDADPEGRIIEEDIAPAVIEALGSLPEDFRRNWHKYAHHAGWDVYFDQARDPEDPTVANYPSIWPVERMNEYERASSAEFQAQCQNMPGERRDMPLSREHVDRMWIAYEDVPADVWNNIYIHMDLAWKNAKNYHEARGDWNVIQVWGRDNAQQCYYLPFAYRGRDMRDGFRREWVQIMQQLYKKRAHIKLMTYDKPEGGMGTSVQEWFRDVAVQEGFRCPPIAEQQRRSQAQKDERSMMASRYWIDGTVKLVRHAPHVGILVDEMLGIGVTRYDDMRDAAADHFSQDAWRGGNFARRTTGTQPGGQQNPWDSYFKPISPDRAPVVLGDPGLTPLEPGFQGQVRSFFNGR